MRIDVEIAEDGTPIQVLKEVYSGVGLRTSERNSLGICMRDDTFEINVMPRGSKESCWFRVWINPTESFLLW